MILVQIQDLPAPAATAVDADAAALAPRSSSIFASLLPFLPRFRLWVNLFRAITNIQVRSSTITIQLFGTVPLQFTDTSSTAIFYVLWVPRPTARPLYAYTSPV